MISHALALLALALGAIAQNANTPRPTASAQTTIGVLVGSLTSGFAGSIVSASGCDTTVALQCTDDSIPICSSAPDVTVTITQGPTYYEVVYATSSLGVAAAVSESCDLEGPAGAFTQAVCTGSVSISGPGLSTETTTSVTITNTDDFNYAQIPITAGASKLPSGSAVCTATSAGSSGSMPSDNGTPSSTGGAMSSDSTTSATSSTSEGAAAPTGIRQVYKILVPVGAAVVAGATVLI